MPNVQPNEPPDVASEPQVVAVFEPLVIAASEPPVDLVKEPPVVPMTEPSMQDPYTAAEEASPSEPPPSNPLASGYGSATWLSVLAIQWEETTQKLDAILKKTPMPVTTSVAATFAPAPHAPVDASTVTATTIMPAAHVPVTAPAVQSSMEVDAAPACL
ncbi:lysine-rich arabinogalactan protein 19-like [Cynara cardunculus var. scolymus]|uniref:lysine-rich arabinogalactan protein 19-like n=1 Tax=Cynara cardunculus var. scolymus TaxID=59895 RepID=UPI000D62D736|nr:lysine-rich arabinogalactan protein 19-like [Cynara cardunculus var. scolymus]